jgi:hypothetical protein
VFILKGVKVLCFDTLLQVLIPKELAKERGAAETFAGSAMRNALDWSSSNTGEEYHGDGDLVKSYAGNGGN